MRFKLGVVLLFLLLFGPCFGQGLRLNTYNSWQEPGDDRLLARFDNVCFTEMWRKVTPDQIRALNPRAKVYRLYNLWVKDTWDSDWNRPEDTSRMQFPLTRAQIDANDWWLRDGKGNIVKQSADVWFVDVGKPGVKEAFLSSLLSRMEGKGFDGLVFDYWQPGLSDELRVSKASGRPSAYPTDRVWFAFAWKPFVGYVMAGLHKAGYRVIGNMAGEYRSGNAYQDWQRTQIDGTVYERWGVDWPTAGGKWQPADVIAKRIAAMRDDPLEVWTADYGLRSTDPEFAAKKAFSLAMYYIAVPANRTDRSFHYFQKPLAWDPLWSLDIGRPLGEPVRVGNVWTRRFTGGTVVLDADRHVGRIRKR